MASTTRGEFERQRGELIKEIAEVPQILSSPTPSLYVVSLVLTQENECLFNLLPIELRARPCQYQQTQSQPRGCHHSGQRILIGGGIVEYL